MKTVKSFDGDAVDLKSYANVQALPHRQFCQAPLQIVPRRLFALFHFHNPPNSPK